MDWSFTVATMELKSSGLPCGSAGSAGVTVSSFLASCTGDGAVAPLAGTAASFIAAAGGAATGAGAAAGAATGAEAVTGGADSPAVGGVSEALGAAISSVVG